MNFWKRTANVAANISTLALIWFMIRQVSVLAMTIEDSPSEVIASLAGVLVVVSTLLWLFVLPALALATIFTWGYWGVIAKKVSSKRYPPVNKFVWKWRWEQ